LIGGVLPLSVAWRGGRGGEVNSSRSRETIRFLMPSVPELCYGEGRGYQADACRQSAWRNPQSSLVGANDSVVEGKKYSLRLSVSEQTE
jgi:hypothetical protein